MSLTLRRCKLFYRGVYYFVRTSSPLLLLVTKMLTKNHKLNFAEVNAGPLEICRVFLSEGEVKKGCTPEQINRLMDVMREFTRKLGFALKLNHRLVEARDQQIQVQEQLEASYQDFVREVTKYLSLEVEPGTASLF